MEQKIIAKLGERDYVLWNEDTIRNRDQFVSDIIEFSNNISTWQLSTILCNDSIVSEEFTKEVEYIRELILLANPQTKRTKFDSSYQFIITVSKTVEKIDMTFNLNKEEGKNVNNPNQQIR